MNIKLAQLKTQIALGYLRNKLITINFKKAFKWASGWRTPFYVDNREALSIPPLRGLVVAAFLETIKEQALEWDAIWATVTAGIPWAAILAHTLEKDLYIYDEKRGRLYCYKNLKDGLSVAERMLGNGRSFDDIDAIISNTPHGIVYGSIAAHITDKPFLYLREKRKEHGKQNWIEGRYQEGIRAFYMHITPDDIDEALFNEEVSRLQTEKLELSHAAIQRLPEVEVKLPNIIGKTLEGVRMGIVEDLISTAGSSLGTEASNCRNFGAIVEDLIAVFHYKMERAAHIAKEANINVHYIIDFPALLETATAGEIITTAEKAGLEAWYANPQKWSDDYLESHPHERDKATA